MKATNQATFSLLVLSIAAVAQQSAVPLSEPETLNVFYRLNNGTLVSLERQTTTGVQVQHGFMSSKVAGVTEVPGGKSLVRFQTGPLEFVVAMGGDPAVYSLRKLEIKKHKRNDTRELLIVTAQGAVFGATKADTAEGLLSPA
jgi:hypothetical protein